MPFTELLVYLLIGAVCAKIGHFIFRYSQAVFILSIIIGFLGAMLGVWISTKFDLAELYTISIAGNPFPLSWSIFSSAICITVLGIMSR